MRRIVSFFSLIILSHFAFSQDFQPSVNDLVEETQRSTGDADKLRLVWWVPVEFWEVSLASDPSMTKEQLTEFIDVLDDYTMIGVIEGTVGPFGGITYESRNAIKEELTITSTMGTVLRPLDDDDINPDAQNLLDMLKPIFSNMLGNMGENLQMMLFEGYESGLDRVADPKKEGVFKVQVFEETLEWKLPLGSLMPPKTCPVDGQLLNGAWLYCPWHGKKLE